jgi:hypothetical protein
MAVSCSRFSENDAPVTLEGESWVSLSFGDGSYNDVNIVTKSTLGIVPESRIQNIYLFVFDAGGRRVYRHYFDDRNRATVQNPSDEATVWNNVMTSKFDSWYVINSVKTTDELGDTDAATRTRGRIWMKAPHVSNGEIYAVANIDGDMVNISPEKLDLVETKADLLNITCQLNQLIITRNGYFTMVAHKAGITVQGEKKSMLAEVNKESGPSSSEWRLEFERVDAKVEFRVRAAIDYEYYDGPTDPSDPNPATRQRVKSFEPDTWQVINIPKGCSLVNDSSATTDASEAEEAGYFDTEPIAFENSVQETFTHGGQNYTANVHSFSFYMMENRELVKSGATPALSGAADYHKRDLRLKDPATGAYTATSGDMWKYAPQWGTYVIIKGEVLMEVKVSDNAKTQTLNAAATYVIHLGDFASDVNNFSIFRNTSYIYTITIMGADKIAKEVSTSESGNPALVQELNSGAMGSVNIAKESTFTFDSHFGQRVFSFDAEQIDINNTYWYVKSPFGKEGTPPRVPPVTGKDIPTGYDYRWVWFMVNDYCTNADVTDSRYSASWAKYYDGNASMAGFYPYQQKNLPYPGDAAKNQMVNGHKKLMDVVEFMEFLRDQKALYNADVAAGRTGNDQVSLFRDEWDQDWYDWTFRPAKAGEAWSGGGRDSSNPADIEFANGKAHRHRIWVTCYVDEYYYYEDPITGDAPQDLWKQFVNQPNRMMYILSDSEDSLDGDSHATGSVITIRQRAIQTPYNLERAELKTAWGTEVVDETDGLTYFFNKNEGISSQTVPSQCYVELPFNTSNNGLYNTASNWLLIDGGTFRDTEPWADHMEYNTYNDQNYIFLKDDQWNATQRWSCLMRNRDDDGDGYIDANEIKWYMASEEQIQHMFFGNLGLSEEAATYSKAWTYKPGHRDANCPVHPVYGVKVDLWRRHFTSSSITSTDDWGKGQRVPNVIKVEEGPTTGKGNYRNDLRHDNKNKLAPYTMRCIRNLGLPDATASTIVDKQQNIPELFIKVYKNGSTYTFDCENINTKSLRGYSSRELEPSDEFSESSRLYKRFESGPQVMLTGMGGNSSNNPSKSRNFILLHDMLLRGESPCPDGYRVPNIREGAVMYMFAAQDLLTSHTLVSTYFSNSTFNSNGLLYINNGANTWPAYPAPAGYTQYGNANDYNSTKNDAEKGKISWMVQNVRINITVSATDANKIRCVRDVKVD